MNFDGNFHPIAQVDISAVKELVLQITPEQWVSDMNRQERYEVHKDTQAIGLVYDLDFRHTNPTRHPALDIFGTAIRPILATIANYYDNTPKGKLLAEQVRPGYCIRANLVRLNPNGKIDPHEDKNFSLTHSHRIHVPIITNNEVFFSVGGELYNMYPGEMVEINNRREHWVENRSTMERVHLILDWVIAGEQCCCSEKNHPGIPCSQQACMQTDRLQVPCECFPFDPSRDNK
ncbi:MAG: aspartyl/asparaginyl beta-hydroxylase domain-containing protein [Kangiellaceae bacterium]|nr:aspartyl/asparaginyl beta-hydroxylase domain-containing protein [Kangiellaceae bacterium]